MSDSFELAVIIKRFGDKAVLVTDTITEAWIPKSQIEDWDDDEHCIGEECEITVPEWLAIDKGFA